ncbi:MAG: hypothetical protein R3E86_00365 [Pseudomonadales bacterium]
MLKRLLSGNFTECLPGLLLALVLGGCSGGGSQSSDPVPIPGATPDGITNVVARPGPIVQTSVGDTAVLDGSKSISSPDQVLTFDWSFSSMPDGSTAELMDATFADPSFVPDVAGTYVVQLLVSADGVTSRRAVQVVVASDPGSQSTFHEGLSSNCVNCHVDAFSPIPGKSLDHMATTDLCGTCHTPSPAGFADIHFVDHREVFGACSECHDGVRARGKSDVHPATQAECDNCHNTTSFVALNPDGSFDHTGVVGGCSDCHNGGVARGKTPTPPHPDTTSECIACHTTATFLEPFPDHFGPDVVGNRCDSCHGVSARGPIAGHPQTFVDCGECHSVATFSMGGVFNHRIDPAVQPCESCHNDATSINARSKSSAASHPATSEDCGMCHNTTSFADAFVDHTGIVDNCASCHGVTAVGKSPNHMPTTEDCSVCHTPGTFATGTYDHFGVVSGCEACHDNVISVGKLPNHLPTTEDCAACHNTTAFADATFDHVGIDTSNCAACHNDQISIGKPQNHVPTDLDCSSCHNINDFTTFAGITYNHEGIDPNDCASCHATGIGTPKPATHIPAQDDCSVCHDSTTTFTSTTFLISLHPDIVRGCEGCHTGRFFPNNPDVVKGVGHLPTAQDCNFCHTNTAFVPSTFDHVGITGNCASCHDGSTTFVALGARGAPSTPIHQNTSGDCSTCHNTGNFADAFVDHNGPEVIGARCDSCHNGVDATGKDAKVNPPHVPTTQDCGTCHVPGGSFAPAVFNHTGIVDNCASCHNGVDAIGTEAKTNPPHIPITQDCSACHTPTTFAGAKFDHQGITGNCASCHNGSTATGKPDKHVPTNQDCVNCHQTTGFLPATFDHVGIVDNCASCHDAGFATGKSDTHLPTNQDCGVCHNTRAFTPATFDHTGIVDGCESCHDGVTAIGKDAKTNPAHLQTSLDCHFCHTTATFVGGSWVHDSSTVGRCDDCHTQGGGATFKPLGHLATTVQCDECHTTAGWAPTSFRHDPQGNYPGDHRRDPGCTGCHGASVDAIFVYPSPQYAPYCAACHARDFRPKDRHIGGKSGTVEQNKNCGASGCHRVSASGFD